MKKNKKNGVDLKPYKNVENFETRKKIKYDTDMYQNHPGILIL
jgi:hypothetical protein